MTLVINNVADFTNAVRDGKFFTVVFTKKTDGSLRKMTARLGVKKGVKGVIDPEVRAEEDRRNGVLTVYDMAAAGFRRINLQSLHTVKVQGKTWAWNNATGKFARVK